MLASRARRRVNVVSLAFDVINYLFLALLGVVTLGPFLYLVLGSLTQTDYYRAVGVSLAPSHWTLNAYRILLGGGFTRLPVDQDYRLRDGRRNLSEPRD